MIALALGVTGLGMACDAERPSVEIQCVNQSCDSLTEQCFIDDCTGTFPDDDSGRCVPLPEACLRSNAGNRCIDDDFDACSGTLDEGFTCSAVCG